MENTFTYIIETNCIYWWNHRRPWPWYNFKLLKFARCIIFYIYREYAIRQSECENQGESRGIQECTLLCRPKLHLGDSSANNAKIAPSKETPHKAPAVTSWRGVPDLGDLAASSKSPAQLSADNPASPSPVQVFRSVLQAPAKAQQTPQPAALS